MRTSSASPLLVAALMMLRRPCSRNRAAAQLLLKRAAEHGELTPAEREACRNLADDLERECPQAAGASVRTAPRPARHAVQARRPDPVSETALGSAVCCWSACV